MILIVLAVLLAWILTPKRLKNNLSSSQETCTSMDYEIHTNSYTKKQVDSNRMNQPVRETSTQSHQTVPVEDNTSDFATSLAVAYATDSAILGTLVGGDPVGAMIGDSLNDRSDSSWDSSDSSSSDSSWDSSDSSSSSFD